VPDNPQPTNPLLPADEIDKVLADAVFRGLGFLRITPNGVKHVAFNPNRGTPIMSDTPMILANTVADGSDPLDAKFDALAKAHTEALEASFRQTTAEMHERKEQLAAEIYNHAFDHPGPGLDEAARHAGEMLPGFFSNTNPPPVNLSQNGVEKAIKAIFDPSGRPVDPYAGEPLSNASTKSHRQNLLSLSRKCCELREEIAEAFGMKSPAAITPDYIRQQGELYQLFGDIFSTLNRRVFDFHRVVRSGGKFV